MCEKFVIYDCDGGADDAWALQILLRAEKLGKIKILGITIIKGNANLHDASTNVFRILKACSRLDIPVYQGAPDSMLINNLDGVNFYHGKNGFGDVKFSDQIHTEKLVQKKHAVDAMNEAVMKYPNKVTIISVGPQTNVALCLVKYGEEFAKRVEAHYIMGGNFEGVGNSSGAAEFNFFLDPEAAHIVLSKAKSPIVVFPWEACIEPRFMISTDWRFNVLAKSDPDSPFLKLLNKVEEEQLLKKGYKDWVPCDAMLVCVLLFGSQIVLKESNWKATVELNGTATRGQMVLDHVANEGTKKNIRLVQKIDDEYFKKVALWAANCGCSDLKRLMQTHLLEEK